MIDENLNKPVPAVRLRAFRAINDHGACEKFIIGHAQVLSSIGVKKITSSNADWMYNPAVFVFIVESLDQSKVYGGIRLHIAGGNQPLPIEEATGELDSGIYDLVKQYAANGTGEGCGLWNSREIAGYGIGSIFLSRAGVAISKIVGIQSLFALCAPYTIKLAEGLGYRKDERLGQKGTFYYPKMDLLATVMILEDINDTSTITLENLKAMEELRNNGKIVRIEELRNKKIEIHYEVDIPKLNEWDLKSTIDNAMTRKNKTSFNEQTFNLLY